MIRSPKPLGQIEKLNADHAVDLFDCGKEPLDRFLKRYALGNQKIGSAQTYVICRDKNVVGYYSICVGSVEHDHAPQRIIKGLPRHPVPIMLLARLAVDHTEQGRGLGRALLKDCLLRTSQVASITGLRALLVHAKDSEARAWYETFDFEASPSDPYHLFLLRKDLLALLK